MTIWQLTVSAPKPPERRRNQSKFKIVGAFVVNNTYIKDPIMITKNVLQTLNRVAAKNIRITSNGKKLTMSATALNVAAQFSIKSENPKFDVLVNAHKFCRVLRNVEATGFCVDNGNLVVQHDKGYACFPIQKTAEFPELTMEGAHHLGTISADFSMVENCIGDGVSLCMVAIGQDGTIKATNGYAMALVNTDDFLSEDAHLEGNAILKISSQLNGEISINRSEGKYVLNCDNWTFWVPKSVWKGPDYNSVIPKSFTHNAFSIDVDEFMSHVSNASTVNRLEMMLSINDDTIEIGSESLEGVKWNSRIDASTDGSEISVCLDPANLINALTQIKKVSNEVTLRMNHGVRPVSLASSCGACQFIIMPKVNRA